MKVLAVGDIHTKQWILEAVEKAASSYDAVIFVGDYADDWNSGPLRTIETWRALKDLPVYNTYFVIGNHDYIYINKTRTISSGYNQTTQMLIDLPENRSIKGWLESLPVTKTLDGVVYSHAGVTADWSEFSDQYDLWDAVSPLWARPNKNKYKNIPQVFGHTPSQTCWEVEPNIWCIDTFSTYPDGTPIGDGTVLEIIDGKEFNKIKLNI